MRGKRAKSYRRQMEAYVRGFSFREPYQVLLDAEFVRETSRCAMDLDARVTQVLHGKIKPIITQCSMRHLYATARTTPAASAVVDSAKAYERRRCGHRPSEYPTPLPERECIASVVGATNKHRYVVASQDEALRRELREVLGTPLLHVRRSVMIMEPMARATVEFLEKGERAKFRGGLRGKAGVEEGSGKRKREEEDVDGDGDEVMQEDGHGGEEDEWDGLGDDAAGSGQDGGDGDDGDKTEKPKRVAKPPQQQQRPRQDELRKKKKRKYGPKGPNPLSVKRAKKRPPRSSA